MAIKKGDKVKIEYTGKFDDGTVFDASERHEKPLEFVAGENQVIKGLDNEIIGMEVNQEKDIKIEPDMGYGQRNEELLKKIPKDKIKSEGDLKEGMMLMVSLADGKQVPGMISAIDDQDATIDLNHPLAGKTLHFHIKVVE